MSPRLNVWGACRAVAIRARPVAPRTQPIACAIRRTQWYSTDGANPPSKPIENSKEVKTPSEPASSTPESGASAAESKSASVAGEASLHSDEILSDAHLEQAFFGGHSTNQVEGGLTAAQEEVLYKEGSIPSPEQAEALVAAANTVQVAQTVTQPPKPEHKFGLPNWTSKEGINLKKRYHPVLEQITRLLMRHGKLSVAQRNMAVVMNHLRTAPAPIYSPKFPLLPGTPPAAYLPLNPILYITVAIDSVAPLLKIRNVAGAGGGGRALELPVPLQVRQRRRVAFQWILDVVNKKPSKGSGRNQFPLRIADEIIAVVEGRSGVWEKRKQVHKLGTAARANVGSNKLKMKRKRM